MLLNLYLIPYQEKYLHSLTSNAGRGGSVGCMPNWCSGGQGFNPWTILQQSSVDIGHEILSMDILSLPLIPEAQLSASGERICTIMVNHI